VVLDALLARGDLAAFLALVTCVALMAFLVFVAFVALVDEAVLPALAGFRAGAAVRLRPVLVAFRAVVAFVVRRLAASGAVVGLVVRRLVALAALVGVTGFFLAFAGRGFG
jgi:hypothetical protein